jgi:hypothetical protein
VLLGVFFALGYTMGRNAGPAPVMETANVTPTPTDPVPVRTMERPVAAEETVASPASSSTPVATHEEAPRSERTAEPAPQAASVDRSTGGVEIDPRPGDTYLQVTAVKRPEAELLVDVLARKGFKAGIAPAPIENMFRVLVGPVRGEAEQGKLKTALERAGFKPIPRRY